MLNSNKITTIFNTIFYYGFGLLFILFFGTTSIKAASFNQSPNFPPSLWQETRRFLNPSNATQFPFNAVNQAAFISNPSVFVFNSGINLENKDIATIRTTLAGCSNRPYQFLSLKNCKINDHDLSYLTTTYRNFFNRLTSLNLYGCYSITDVGITAIEI